MTKKVLYCEDDNLLAETIFSLILDELFPCNIDYVSNGLDAFNKLQNNKYDLIISDNSVPSLKGIDLYHKLIKANKLEVPFILYTGDRVKKPEGSLFHLIEKPIAPRHFRFKLNQIITPTL